MTQPTLTGPPPRRRTSIWSKVRDAGGRIHDGAWRTAIALHEHVGSCGCGGQLKPGEPDSGSRHVVFYPATCNQCGHEVVTPGGKERKDAR